VGLTTTTQVRPRASGLPCVLVPQSHALALPLAVLFILPNQLKIQIIPGQHASFLTRQPERERPMAQHLSTIACEDIPLDEARRMSRPPHMKPTLYDRLRHRIQSRSVKAVRVHLDPAMTPTRVKRSSMTSAIVLGCIALFGCTSPKSGLAPPAETATPSLVADSAPIGPPPGYVQPENYWVREKIILTSAPEPSVPETQKRSGKKAKKSKKIGKPSSSPM